MSIKNWLKMLTASDIQKLRDLPIERVAERLGLSVSRGRARCPFHDDSHPSLMFRRGKNSYRCFVCGAHGSGPIDLVMRYLGKSFVEACHWLADAHNVIVTTERKPQPSTARRATPQIDLVHLESLIAHPVLIPEAVCFLFEQRGIREEVVGRLGLSSIAHPVPMTRNLNDGWFNAPALLIPYRDVEGRLLSVQARYLGKEPEKPRFQFPKGAICGIYNLPELRQLQEGEALFLTEGCSDCWAMLSAGHKAISIPSATLLKTQDLQLLHRLNRQQASLNLHICPDRDAPGERLYVELKEHFPQLVRHQLPEGFKDFGQWWAAQNVALLPVTR